MVNNKAPLLDTLFAALSDPTRRAILDQLSREGTSTVTSLAEPHDMSLPAVSKHLRILEDAGLVIRRKSGRTHHLALNGQPLKDAAAWLDQYSRFWQQRFDALGQFLSKPETE